jgi:hypothetical protein
MSEETTYRRRQQPQGGVCRVSSRELTSWLFHHEPSDVPENSCGPRAEWYCPNENCVVREVVVRCKTQDEPLPGMCCPACGGPLDFHHWLNTVVLKPVPAK